MNTVERDILKIVESIQPLDAMERAHINDAARWIRTATDGIFRISKPDNPPKHLVAYFVPIDIANHSLLLIDHVKSGLWLPPGGHVEINENPVTTVEREAHEEIELRAVTNIA